MKTLFYSYVKTNAAHIIGVSLKMAYEIKSKHVGEVTNKWILECKKLVLILLHYNTVSRQIYNVKIKKYLQKVGLGGGGHGLHWSGSEYKQVVGSCKCSNDLLGSI